MERDRFRDFMPKREKPLSRRVKRGIAAFLVFQFTDTNVLIFRENQIITEENILFRFLALLALCLSCFLKNY